VVAVIAKREVAAAPGWQPSDARRSNMMSVIVRPEVPGCGAGILPPV
jgi:hypothetical protein